MRHIGVITSDLITDGLIVMMSRLLRAIMDVSMAYLIMNVYMCSHISRCDRVMSAEVIMSLQTATRQRFATGDSVSHFAGKLTWWHFHLRSSPSVSQASRTIAASDLGCAAGSRGSSQPVLVTCCNRKLDHVASSAGGEGASAGVVGE